MSELLKVQVQTLHTHSIHRGLNEPAVQDLLQDTPLCEREGGREGRPL